MPVIKPKLTEKYTVIPNATLRDKSLSFEARGVLALMVSMPADWEMYKSWLVDQCGMTGKDKMTRILKELEDAKYLIRQRKRNDSGRFDSWDWFIYSEPFTENGLAGDGSPDNGKSAPTKERVKQSKDNTNKSSGDDNSNAVLSTYHFIVDKKMPNWSKSKTMTSKRKDILNKAIATVKPRAKEIGLNPLEYLENLLSAMAQDPFYSGKQPSRDKPNGYQWTIDQVLRADILAQAIDRLSGD